MGKTCSLVFGVFHGTVKYGKQKNRKKSHWNKLFGLREQKNIVLKHDSRKIFKIVFSANNEMCA